MSGCGNFDRDVSHNAVSREDATGYAGCVLIADAELKHSHKPRFDKRSIFAGLIIWCFALVLAVSLYIFAAFHPPSPGERDLGEGVLLFSGFFAAIIVFLAGAMSMILGLVHFLWLSWRFSRRSTTVVTVK